MDKKCHRSATAGPAQAARNHELADPHSSVTFVFLACSGANLLREDVDEETGRVRGVGVLGRYEGREPDGVMLEPQIDEVKRLVGDRQIDALIVSAGGNDAGFADVIRICVDPRDPRRWDCSKQGNLISERVEELPNQYAALNQRMNELNLNVDKDKVYLTEYPIGTRGNAFDGYCANYGGDPLLFNIDLDEARYITEMMAQPLNQKMREAAQTYGWTYVGDINKEFSRPLGEKSHGYCSDEPWVRTMVESNHFQGPQSHWGEAWIDTDLWQATTGTLHPNAMGHDVYKTRILDAIFRATSPGPTFSASEPEYSSGRVVVRVKATDPSGIVSNSVSVNATGGCQVEGIACTTRRLDGQTLEWTLEVTREGLHTFDFVAKDGDEQGSSFVHEVEYLPPAPPVISGPTNGSYDRDGSVTFSGAAEAGSTITLFEADNPEPVGSATADASNSWSLTLTSVAEGVHSYTATATNSRSGLTSVASAPVRVTVDTTKPTIGSLVPVPGSSTRDSTPSIKATVRDSQTNLAKTNMRLFIDGKRVTTFGYDRATDRLSYTATSALSLGSHTVKIEARDAAGNVTTKQWSFKVVR